MSHAITQQITLEASPADVYAVLTRADRFSTMSGGAPTEIEATAGGAFSCFGGMIYGRNLDLVPNERVVQAWRAKNWDAGTYSIVRFDLETHDGGTRIHLTHAAFPEGQGEHLAKGWHDNYWQPLRELLS